jgi:hypothetical protein
MVVVLQQRPSIMFVKKTYPLSHKDFGFVGRVLTQWVWLVVCSCWSRVQALLCRGVIDTLRHFRIFRWTGWIILLSRFRGVPSLLGQRSVVQELVHVLSLASWIRLQVNKFCYIWQQFVLLDRRDVRARNDWSGVVVRIEMACARLPPNSRLWLGIVVHHLDNFNLTIFMTFW